MTANTPIDGGPIETCSSYCSITACDVCGEMALDKGQGAFCPFHPDAEVVTLRRETCPHRNGETTVPLSQLSAAVDEIYALRRALAYEALVINAHLGYKTFPKSRRRIAETQIERMQQAARGHAYFSYGGVAWQSLRGSLREAGASETLTNTEWLRATGLADG